MYKVLIVDDEQLIRSGMIARFQYLNFKFERIREAASLKIRRKFHHVLLPRGHTIAVPEKE